MFNSNIKKQYKELKQYTETYVFNGSRRGVEDNSSGTFSTDGDKLFINYKYGKTDPIMGEGRLSSLYHEATHATQFENGKLGFVFIFETPIQNDCDMNYRRWVPTGYTMNDELEAWTYENLRFSLVSKNTFSEGNVTKTTVSNEFMIGNKERKIQILQQLGYNLPLIQINNENSVKIKNSFFYQMPHR